jgi:hypothetical protein
VCSRRHVVRENHFAVRRVGKAKRAHLTSTSCRPSSCAGLSRASTPYCLRARTKDVDGRVKPGHDGADVAGDAGGTDLPDASSPAAKNISLFGSVETAIELLPFRAHQEGRYASSRTWSAGCDGREAVPQDERRCPRTAKSYCPDAPTQASSSRKVSAGDGVNKARSPGRLRRKP